MNTIKPINVSPVLHVFTVKVAPQMCRSERQRFFRRMQRDMGRAGLIMNHSGGFCLAVKERDVNWRTDRHLFVDWLIDQPQSRELVVAAPASLRRLLEGEYNLEVDLVRLNLAEEAVSRWLITKVLTGLMTRAIHRLQIDQEV